MHKNMKSVSHLSLRLLISTAQVSMLPLLNSPQQIEELMINQTLFREKTKRLLKTSLVDR